MRVGGYDLRVRRFLVAEIASNHEGDLGRALELVDAAAEAGADAVKFQVIRPERLAHRSQRERIEELRRFALSREALAELAARAGRRHVRFFASAFDLASLDEVEPLCDALKIATGDLDFFPLIERAAASGKPLLLSTGAATLAEVDAAVGAVEDALPPGTELGETLALLHCVSAYPAPLEECNLRAIGTLARVFPELVIGWSDHTLGIAGAVAAAALGARVIEKHFTLDRRRTTSSDHAFSVEPAELAELAGALHSLDDALGDGDKHPAPCEREMRSAIRRSLVAARDLRAGQRLALEDLDFVRPPCGGLPPAAVERVVGSRLAIARGRHDPILDEHLT